MSDLCQVLGPVEINGRALRVGRREGNTGEPKSTPNDVEHAGGGRAELLARGLTQGKGGGGGSPGPSTFKLSVTCSDLQSRVFKIERGGWSMTAPKRLEIQRQVSRHDRRCRDDLDSGSLQILGTTGRAHTRAASLSPGAWWQPITTRRGRRGPEREEKRSA